MQPYVGIILLVCLNTESLLVQAQQIWSNAMLHPWATSLKCSGTTLQTTVPSQPVQCVFPNRTADETPILPGACNNKEIQWFNIVKVSATQYEFFNVHSGKCIDGWGQETGTQIAQSDCLVDTDNAVNQDNVKFTLEYTRAVTGCLSSWASYRIKWGGTQCFTMSGSKLVWQPCAADKYDTSQNFFIQGNSGVGCTKYQTVQAGDTCTAISTANKLTSTQLNALNPGINCTNLPIGQVLCTGASSWSPPPPVPVPTPPTPYPGRPWPEISGNYGTMDDEPSLREACDLGYTIIVLSFLTMWGNFQDVSQPKEITSGYPGFDGDQKLIWAAIGRDIPYCQSKNIKVTLSMSDGDQKQHFYSSADAQWTADQNLEHLLGRVIAQEALRHGNFGWDRFQPGTGKVGSCLFCGLYRQA
eukprot:jgi/Botrbrau1/19513/Bobra.0035s0013.1